MKDTVKEWTTSELSEFLTSYNRVYELNREIAVPYMDLYIYAYAEFGKRQPMMALLL